MHKKGYGNMADTNTKSGGGGKPAPAAPDTQNKSGYGGTGGVHSGPWPGPAITPESNSPLNKGPFPK